MKTLVAIPSRFRSSRFPGKPLALINGKPMIEWVVLGVLKSKLVTDVVVMTDDQRIFDIVSKLSHVKPLMTSEKCETGTDRIFDGLQRLEKLGKTYDYVVNVQGDYGSSAGFDKLMDDPFVHRKAKVFINVILFLHNKI